MANILHMETDIVRAVAQNLLQASAEIETAVFAMRASAGSMQWESPSRIQFDQSLAELDQQIGLLVENGHLLSNRLTKEVDEWETTAASLANDGSVPANTTNTNQDSRAQNAPEKPNDPLFKKGQGDAQPIQYDDVNQKDYADCSFMADLAAIAKRDPEQIKQMVTANDDGTYTVRFFDNGEPVYIQVNDSKPISDNMGFWRGTKHGAVSSDPGELWPSVIEKAYAQWKGGNTNIEWGNPAVVFSEITGKHAVEMLVSPIVQKEDDTWISQYSSPDMMENLQKAMKGNDPIIFSTTDNPGSGLYGKHAYTVEKIVGDEIYLYNPWGTHHAQTNINQLEGNFAAITILPFGDTTYKDIMVVTTTPEF